MRSFTDIVTKLESPLDSQDRDIAFWNPEYWSTHADNGEYWLTQKHSDLINKNLKILLEAFNDRNAKTKNSVAGAHKELLALQKQIESEVTSGKVDSEEKKYLYAIAWVYCKALRRVIEIEAQSILRLTPDIMISTCNLLFNLKLCSKSIIDVGKIDELYRYFEKVLFKRILPDPYSHGVADRDNSTTLTTDAGNTSDSPVSSGENDTHNVPSKKKLYMPSLTEQIRNKKLLYKNIDEVWDAFLGEVPTRNCTPRYNNRWNCILPSDSSYADEKLRVLATFVYFCRDYKYLFEIMSSFNKQLCYNIASLSRSQLKSYHLLIARKFSGEAREKYEFDQLMARGDMSKAQVSSIIDEQSQHIATVQAEEAKCLTMFAQELSCRGIPMEPHTWRVTTETNAIVSNARTAAKLRM